MSTSVLNRRRLRPCAATAILIATMIGGCGPDSAPDVSPPALATIASGDIRTHMTVLAADDMQGREAGTAGHEKAAQYVASRFASYGLQPAGDAGTYFQNIDFLETQLLEGTATMILHHGIVDMTLEPGRDFVQSGGYGENIESVTAPLVFVGFGIRAPEYVHDDFAGMDVTGKIVIALSGAPPGFGNNERAFYSSGAGKMALAAELGAVGIVTIRTPVDQKRLTWSRTVTSAAGAGLRWLDVDGVAHDGFPQLKADVILSEAGAAKLLSLAGHDLDGLFTRHTQGSTDSFELGVTATLARQSAQTRTSSANVLAMLAGSDIALRNEYIVVTAHLDHLGAKDGVQGDNIFNGAYDNAAGVATMLELSRILATGSPAPRRSIIFAAVTAEEKGLRGSDFLARNPPVGIDQVVANINIDMPFLGHPIADVEGFGVEHSTLHEALIAAAEAHGLMLTPDPQPELVRLIRSDQFSFVKQGVPGLNLKAGSRSSDPAIDGAQLRATFLREHYHSPNDDLELPYNQLGAERFANTALSFTLIVANDENAPRWKEGDFFGARFGGRDR